MPAGTPAKVCKGPRCRQLVYWIKIGTHRRVPVDCDVEGGIRPTPLHDPRQLDAFDGTATIHDGRGRSHFETCPDQWRID